MPSVVWAGWRGGTGAKWSWIYKNKEYTFAHQSQTNHRSPLFFLLILSTTAWHHVLSGQNSATGPAGCCNAKQLSCLYPSHRADSEFILCSVFQLYIYLWCVPQNRHRPPQINICQSIIQRHFIHIYSLSVWDNRSQITNSNTHTCTCCWGNTCWWKNTKLDLFNMLLTRKWQQSRQRNKKRRGGVS